jgi:hypothetical protein
VALPGETGWQENAGKGKPVWDSASLAIYEWLGWQEIFLLSFSWPRYSLYDSGSWILTERMLVRACLVAAPKDYRVCSKLRSTELMQGRSLREALMRSVTRVQRLSGSGNHDLTGCVCSPQPFDRSPQGELAI